MHLCSYNSHFVASWTRQHELQKYASPGNISDICSCHEGWQSCSFAVDPSAQPRRMIQQNKQTQQYLKALDKWIWVSIDTKLKGSKQNSAVSATKPEATPWLPSGSLLAPPKAQHEGGQDLDEMGQPKSTCVITTYRAPWSLVCLSMLTSFCWDGQINSPWHHCLLITAPINHNCPLWRPLSSQNYTSKCQASLYRST